MAKHKVVVAIPEGLPVTVIGDIEVVHCEDGSLFVFDYTLPRASNGLKFGAVRGHWLSFNISNEPEGDEP